MIINSLLKTYENITFCFYIKNVLYLFLIDICILKLFYSTGTINNTYVQLLKDS